jgi:hypothetical protein
MDFFDSFSWNSAVGIDCELDRRKMVRRIDASSRNLRMFEASGGDMLIHKTTRSLWRLCDDGKQIEPVFSNDILTDEDVREAMAGA